MPEKKSRFVLMCQQFLAFGTVAALAAPAAGVVSLDIVAPAPSTGQGATAAAPAVSTVALVASRPVQPEITEVPLRGKPASAPRQAGRRTPGRPDGKELAVLSTPEKVDGFVTVGVTWDEKVAEEDITVSVRSREDGDWSTWQTVEYHDEHGPTPGSPEARNARQGTDAIVVGDVDEVQVKVETTDGAVPADASRIALLDDLVTFMRRARGVWFTTCQEVARWHASGPARARSAATRPASASRPAARARRRR
jgi:hypothetical protein